MRDFCRRFLAAMLAMVLALSAGQQAMAAVLGTDASMVAAAESSFSMEEEEGLPPEEEGQGKAGDTAAGTAGTGSREAAGTTSGTEGNPSMDTEGLGFSGAEETVRHGSDSTTAVPESAGAEAEGNSATDGRGNNSERDSEKDVSNGNSEGTGMHSGDSSIQFSVEQLPEEEGPIDAELSSATEKPTDAELSSETEKPADAELSSETEKPTDAEQLPEIEKPTESEMEDICRELERLAKEEEAEEADFTMGPMETLGAEAFVKMLAKGADALAGNGGSVTWIRTAGYDTSVGVGGAVGYNGWGTHAFLVKDSEGGEGKTYPAICMSPNLSAPADGQTYTTQTADIFTNEDPTLLKILYYGFGGAGKDWAEQVYFDNHGVWSKEASLIITHTAVSKAFRDLFRERYDATGSRWDYYLEGTTYVKDTEDFLATLKNLSAPPEGSYAQILWAKGATQFLVYLKNGPKRGRLSIHKTADDKAMFQDGDYDLAATFEIYNASTHELVRKLSTDGKGNSKTVSLPQGTYYLKEIKAGTHMQLPSFHYEASGNIQIQNTEVTAEVENACYPHCRVAIQKVTEFGKILTDASGVEFTLSVWNGSRYVSREKLFYDATLKRFCSNVIYADAANPTGKFKVEETRRPTDYDYLPEGTEPFVAYGTVEEAHTASKTRKLKGKTWYYLWTETVENRHEYSVQLQKLDKKTGEPLPGAEFVLYAVVQKDGHLQRLGTMKYDAEAVYNGKRGLYIYGKESRNAAGGELPLLVTEKNGGSFRVVETVQPDNYGGQASLGTEKYTKDFQLTETTPVDRPYLINPDDAAQNTPNPPYGVIKVTKEDAKGRRLSGARFLVREYDAKKREYTQNAFVYYTENADGTFSEHAVSTYYLTDNGDGTYTSDYLPILAGEGSVAAYGRRNEGRYKIIELAPPEGYVNTDNPDAVKVTGRFAKEVQFDTNLPANGVDRQSAVVPAVNPENEVPFRKVAADGETPLMAEFTIWPLDEENIGKVFLVRTADAVEIRCAFDENGTAAWTGEDGRLSFVQLPPGSYEVRETNVSSDWYEPLEDVFTFTVAANGSIDGRVKASEVKVRNTPSVPLTITKVDTEPDEGDVETDFPKGTRFLVYSSIDGTDTYREKPYGEIIWKDGAFVSKKTGLFLRLRWRESNQGKYKVVEVAQTPGYIRDTSPQVVTVPKVPDESSCEPIALSFANEPNHITIRKVDEEGTVLSGAVFELSKKGGDNVTAADFRTLITNEEGAAEAWRLSPGTWVYQETAAPAGYHLDPEARGEFTVDADGHVDAEDGAFTVVNYPEVEVVLAKKDAATGAEIDPASGFPSGTTFGVYAWDEELGDYKSAPIMKIEYIDDYNRRVAAGGRSSAAEEDVTNAGTLSGGGAWNAANSGALAGAGAIFENGNTARSANTEYNDPAGSFSVYDEEADRGVEGLAGAATYTLRYVLDGGSLASPVTSATVGQRFQVNVPRKSGKVFMGWTVTGMTEGQTHYYGREKSPWGNTTTAESLSQTGATHFKNLSEAGGTVTFTANWADPLPYRIRFNLDGGSWEAGYTPEAEVYNGFGQRGSTYPALVSVNSLSLLPPNERLEFAGWKISGLSATVHSRKSNGEEWSGSGTVEKTGAMMFYNLNHRGGTVTFTALWKPVGYGIVYDYQGGTGDEENPTSASIGETFHVNTPTREGYDFAGWDILGISNDAAWTYWDAAGTPTTGTGVTRLSGIFGVDFKDLRTDGWENVSFRATWARYTVTYRLEGGSWPADVTVPFAYTSSSTVSVPIPQRTGYLFAGWRERGTSDVVLGNGETGNVTLTALWRAEGIWVDSSDGSVPVVAKTAQNGGKFLIKELTATQGYIRDTSVQMLDIGEPGIAESHRAFLTFVNTPNVYKIFKVNKKGLRINGAVFRVYCEDTSASAPHLVGNHTTGRYEEEEGVIVLRRIPTGTWHFREVSVPAPYLAHTDIEYTFVVDADGNVDSGRKYQEVTNPEGAAVYIQKVTEEGKPLAGVYFDITREADGASSTRKTDSAGMILLSGVADGTYAIRENQTRNNALKELGFLLTDTLWRIQIAGNTITALAGPDITIDTVDGKSVAVIRAVNRRIRLGIRKQDDLGNALEGAEFLLTNQDTGETKSGRTDGSGLLSIKGPFSDGTWTVTETKAPSGPLAYRRDTHTEVFAVSNGLFEGSLTEKTLSFTNEPYDFEIRKMDDGGNPLAGVRFRVWTDDGREEFVETRLKTDTLGNPVFDELGRRVASALLTRLSTGSYHVEEVDAPDGYALDYGTKDFLVTEDGPVPASLAFVNRPLSVQLRKVDEEGNPLTGAVFELWYLGTEEEPKEEYLLEEVSGQDGYLTISLPGLPRGGYALREVEAPEGYLPLEAVLPFDYDGRKISVDVSVYPDISYDEATGTFTATDHPKKKGILRVYKVDDETGEALTGAVFEARECVGQDGDGNAVYAESGQELVFLEERGVYETDPPLAITRTNGGCFRLVETCPPEGYTGAFDGEVAFSEDAVLQMDGDTFTMEITAPNRPNHFEIWKEDGEGNKLKEAWFKVWREGAATEEEVEAMQTTGGILHLEKLASGTWHAREVPPFPEGFEGSDALLTFVVNEDGSIAGDDHIVAVNKRKVTKYGMIEIKKTDEEGEEMKGVLFRAYPFDTSVGAYPEKGWLLEHRAELNLSEAAIAELLANAASYEFAYDEEKECYRTVQLLPLHASNRSRFLVVEEGFADTAEGRAHRGYAANARREVCLDPAVDPLVVASEIPILRLCIYKAEAAFVNKKNSVCIQKVDTEGNPLTGAVFRITCDDGPEAFPETDLVTGTDGRTRALAGLSEGSYTVREIAAPAGYILHAEEAWHFTVNEQGLLARTDADGEALEEFRDTLVISIENERNGVEVRKVDAEGHPLANVEITFWNPNGELFATRTTGEDGRTEPLHVLSEGLWTYRETKKNGQPYTDVERHFTVSQRGAYEKYGDLPQKLLELRLVNGEREGNVTVEKVDEKTREVLHGAIFSCYAYDPGSCDYNRESVVLTLSEEVDSEGRPTGVYRNPMPLLANAGNNGRFLVVETEGPVDEETGERIYAAGWEREIDLFEKADWEFTVGSGEPAENRPTSFAIYKVDEEGNLLDGAKFRIWPEGNEDAFWEKVTGEDGETGAILLGGLDATKRTPLAAGTTYYYKEVSPPPGGFAIDEKVREFKVDVDGTILGASSGHVKVVNHPRSLLLYAGGEGRLDGLLYGLAAAVGLAVAGICRDRKRRKLVLVRVTNGNGERQADGSAQPASGDAKRQADGSAQSASGDAKRQADGSAQLASGDAKRQADGSAQSATGDAKRQADGSAQPASGDAKRQADGLAQPASGDAKRQQDAAQARASRGRDGKRQVRGVVQIDLGDEEGNVKKRVWMF